jgi:hypothetical protein
MKWIRILALVNISLGLLGLAIYWSRWQVGFATPADCLDAYREASLAGDVEKYESCVAEPLRAEMRRQHPEPKELAEFLRQETKDVKTWVQVHDLRSAGSTVQVDVDEGRMDGYRRIRFRLQRFEKGWLIVGIDQPKLVPARIPFGTHVSKVPEESQPAPPPDREP